MLSLVLHDLDDQLPKAQQIALEALYDSDPEVAQSAILALGRWGSKDVEAVLWEQLKQLASSPDGKIEQALVTAIGQGTNWLAPPEKLALLKDLVGTRTPAQQIEGWIQQWKLGAAAVDANWFPEDLPTFSVLQYSALTEDQLCIKLAQLPHDLDLQWRYWNSGEPTIEKQEAVYERVRADAVSHGIVISQAKNP